MCSRRSMGCVYCIWQLVFADIINNNKLFIIYCDWLYSLDTCILCWTPDWKLDSGTDGLHLINRLWRHLTPDWTSDSVIVCTYTIHLCLVCYFDIILYISFIVCSHVICTCTFPFILTHSLGVLTLWIYTFRYLMLYSIVQVFDENEHVARNLEFSLFDFWYSYFLLFRRFLDSRYILDLLLDFIFLFIWDHV